MGPSPCDGQEIPAPDLEHVVTELAVPVSAGRLEPVIVDLRLGMGVGRIRAPPAGEVDHFSQDEIAFRRPIVVVKYQTHDAMAGFLEDTLAPVLDLNIFRAIVSRRKRPAVARLHHDQFDRSISVVTRLHGLSGAAVNHCGGRFDPLRPRELESNTGRGKCSGPGEGQHSRLRFGRARSRPLAGCEVPDAQAHTNLRLLIHRKDLRVTR